MSILETMFIIISIYTEKAKEYRHNPLTNEQQKNKERRDGATLFLTMVMGHNNRIEKEK